MSKSGFITGLIVTSLMGAGCAGESDIPSPTLETTQYPTPIIEPAVGITSPSYLDPLLVCDGVVNQSSVDMDMLGLLRTPDYNFIPIFWDINDSAYKIDSLYLSSVNASEHEWYLISLSVDILNHNDLEINDTELGEHLLGIPNGSVSAFYEMTNYLSLYERENLFTSIYDLMPDRVASDVVSKYYEIYQQAGLNASQINPANTNMVSNSDQQSAFISTYFLNWETVGNMIGLDQATLSYITSHGYRMDFVPMERIYEHGVNTAYYENKTVYIGYDENGFIRRDLVEHEPGHLIQDILTNSELANDIQILTQYGNTESNYYRALIEDIHYFIHNEEEVQNYPYFNNLLLATLGRMPEDLSLVERNLYGSKLYQGLLTDTLNQQILDFWESDEPPYDIVNLRIDYFGMNVRPILEFDAMLKQVRKMHCLEGQNLVPDYIMDTYMNYNYVGIVARGREQ